MIFFSLVIFLGTFTSAPHKHKPRLPHSREAFCTKITCPPSLQDTCGSIQTKDSPPLAGQDQNQQDSTKNKFNSPTSLASTCRYKKHTSKNTKNKEEEGYLRTKSCRPKKTAEYSDSYRIIVGGFNQTRGLADHIQQ